MVPHMFSKIATAWASSEALPLKHGCGGGSRPGRAGPGDNGLVLEAGGTCAFQRRPLSASGLFLPLIPVLKEKIHSSHILSFEREKHFIDVKRSNRNRKKKRKTYA